MYLIKHGATLSHNTHKIILAAAFMGFVNGSKFDMMQTPTQTLLVLMMAWFGLVYFSWCIDQT